MLVSAGGHKHRAYGLAWKEGVYSVMCQQAVVTLWDLDQSISNQGLALLCEGFERGDGCQHCVDCQDALLAVASVTLCYGYVGLCAYGEGAHATGMASHLLCPSGCAASMMGQKACEQCTLMACGLWAEQARCVVIEQYGGQAVCSGVVLKQGQYGGGFP